jgi:hypothetical protein
MSKENVENRRGRPVLVQYRLVGGPAGVDQRLTVFSDGLVELDERHRSRDCTQLTIGAQELEQISSALEQVPEAVWSSGPTLALARVKRALRRFFTVWLEPDLGISYFQLRRGRRSFAGETGSETEGIAARDLLDNLRVHAFLLAESLKPTGV